MDVLSAKKDCLETFIRKAEKAIPNIALLPKAKYTIEIGLRDVLTPFNGERNDLIICHPPYFNSYKYSSINSLELSWLRINHADVRKNEVREFFKIGKIEKADYYVADMLKALNNIKQTLSLNGTLALMIGDTIIKGTYVPVTYSLISEFLKQNPDIKLEKVVIRVPKYTEASWTTSQRRTSEKVGITLNDFIIIFRRIA